MYPRTTVETPYLSSSTYDTSLAATVLRRLAQQAHIPVATYRLQFNVAFPFAQAAHLVPYLHALGISTCYASPYLKARPGSMHGYDIVDHQALNPDLGSPEDYEAFVTALQTHGMQQILDIVPNHMGIAGGENAWWMDVLENGPSSPYARFFDIDWQPLKEELRAKVLLPILGDHYGAVLENQELRLSYADGAFTVCYYEHRLPVAPRSVVPLLEDCLPLLREVLGSEHPQTMECESILTALSYLPSRAEADPERLAERAREKEVIKRRLARLVAECPVFHTALEQTLQRFNGQRGEPASFDRLDALLNEQAYRLSFWRTAADEINYRRFFDINDLAGLSMDVPAVFTATHALLLDLLEAGSAAGVRIDHPDGLADPLGYFQRLQQAYVLRQAQRLLDSQAAGADSRLTMLQAELAVASTASARELRTRPLYMVVEKILSPGEDLLPSWPVHGTTGYDFLHQLNGLFVARTQARAFRRLYTAFVGEHSALAETVYTAKKLILETAMASELHVLGAHLDRVSETQRNWRDFTRNSLTAALREVIACFPIYRTYVGPTTAELSPGDRVAIDRAVAQARRRNPAVSSAIFDYVHDVLRLRVPPSSDSAAQQAQRQFVQRFQQLTGPIMAKGVEDTAFYRYTPLVSLNEVGGDPETFGLSVAAFHRANRTRRRLWPDSLLATSTHDTKRGEDVRARINVLSEMPRLWRASLQRWHHLNRPYKPRLDGQEVPSLQEEYLLYQTLLGAWPMEPLTVAGRAAFCERIQAYMLKALREAKVHTSWNNIYEPYERAVETFIASILDVTLGQRFLEDFATLQQSVAQYGIWNSLAQTLLKLTSPGIPDFYQGSELWDLRLVDPDNRQPVDYALRQQHLSALAERCQTLGRRALVRELLATRHDSRLKLYLIWQALTYRREHAALFRLGDYVPLEVRGEARRHVCAFVRQHGTEVLVAVAPRLLIQLLPDASQAPLGPSVWGETSLVLPEALGARYYHQLLTDARVEPLTYEGQPALSLATVLADFPVALLEARNA